MTAPPPSFAEPLVQAAFWSLVTVALFLVARRLQGRWQWLPPMAVAPLLVAGVILGVHSSYQDYFSGTKWLLVMLGPVTVAFAVPIYEQRALIRRQWRVLTVGSLAGSLTAIGSSWALAKLVGLDETMVRSLLPRSISTPFAMEVSGDIGGIPNLTAVFVVITGILGALIGDVLLARITVGSALARGALFGLGAHAIGTARAHQIGAGEGAVAGLVMVMVGLLNVLAAPLLAQVLG